MQKLKVIITIFFIIMAQVGTLKMQNSLETVYSTSKAITDVIHEFYITNKIYFDFIIYGKATNHINDVIDEVTKKLSEIIPIEIIHIKDIENWNHELNQSVVFLTESADNLINLHKNSIKNHPIATKLTNLIPKKFKFLVYVEEILEIKKFRRAMEIHNEEISLSWCDLRCFEFIITRNENFINLTANLLFSEKSCGNFEPILLNSFGINSQKWNKELENFNHFDNFHGCMLTISVNFNHFWYTEEAKKYRNSISDNKELITFQSFNYRGISNEVINLAAKKYNFTPHFSIFDNLKGYNEHIGTKNYLGSKLKMIFFLNSYLDKKIVGFHTLDQCDTISYYYLVTPNDLYTNYEKLLMPFDITTWILLTFTISSTFAVVFVSYKIPQWFKDLFYGKNVKDPAYNALGIIFGMSQLKLPNESINRFILLLFIWFCLIFRTCYQSILFEFMISDMRKPLPASIEDLVKYKYTIVLKETVAKDFIKINDRIINGRESPNVIKISTENFNLLYRDAINGEIDTKFAFLVTTFDHVHLNSSLKNSLTIMDNEKITLGISHIMGSNNMLIEAINYIISRFISNGISNHLIEFGSWDLWRPFDIETEDPRKILSLDDLEFGFVLWIFSLSFPIICFLYEIFSYLTAKLLRNVQDFLFTLVLFLFLIMKLRKFYYRRNL
ncbi:hypothetical protein PVAND_015723 [Polypedilum vanderplanki]|uniref:Ionotropic receptor n=1 Tax=Polypedilum vanderplanki TaxID=319348 RepID=A0A9J6BCZ5_POLVA|nr:hypothetical protein PVAND_015723 [Polypedilum vanderplanki]